jgi:hypothetical protein
MTTTTMIMGRKKTMREMKKRATRLKVKMIVTSHP